MRGDKFPNFELEEGTQQSRTPFDLIDTETLLLFCSLSPLKLEEEEFILYIVHWTKYTIVTPDRTNSL
jgi:hypothetical protein